ncbi:MAG: hypothetical protein A3I61_02170 [Acidobacteria bacterium RIFCSPLOWO2_02_FULL_68_18]|nr:MAG: hypothetical protein A3I61_02170 [Acidobacteria bacterium RIFCSPLOWO2_02_FULL_68_18]
MVIAGNPAFHSSARREVRRQLMRDDDLLMLVLFAPIVRFLVSGASSLHVPFGVLLYSVIVFIVIPLAAGVH